MVRTVLLCVGMSLCSAVSFAVGRNLFSFGACEDLYTQRYSPLEEFKLNALLDAKFPNAERRAQIKTLYYVKHSVIWYRKQAQNEAEQFSSIFKLPENEETFEGAFEIALRKQMVESELRKQMVESTRHPWIVWESEERFYVGHPLELASSLFSVSGTSVMPDYSWMNADLVKRILESRVAMWRIRENLVNKIFHQLKGSVYWRTLTSEERTEKIKRTLEKMEPFRLLSTSDPVSNSNQPLSTLLEEDEESKVKTLIQNLVGPPGMPDRLRSEVLAIQHFYEALGADVVYTKADRIFLENLDKFFMRQILGIDPASY